MYPVYPVAPVLTEKPAGPVRPVGLVPSMNSVPVHTNALPGKAPIVTSFEIGTLSIKPALNIGCSFEYSTILKHLIYYHRYSDYYSFITM